jgi:hypothetical protein
MGTDSLILSPEDNLLHFCLHLASHSRKGWLVSSCDITKLIYKYDSRLDWEYFLFQVFESGICLPVRYSIQKTTELFHPPIPQFVQKKLELYTPNRIERWIFTLLTRADSKDDEANRILAEFLSMPIGFNKFRRIASTLLPSRKYLVKYYCITDSKKINLYYISHFYNIFLRSFKAMLRFLKAKKLS